LFNRFERGDAGATDRRGLGLGLYISREIVTAHGGTIDVDSQTGDGTTFTIRLPLATDPAHGRDGHNGTDGRVDAGRSQVRGGAAPSRG
jgi:signal transduction histidine kinase